MIWLLLAAQAATLSVCDTCAHTTLTDAVAVAAAGDTVSIDPGYYVEPGPVVLDQDLTISAAGAVTLTNDAAGADLDSALLDVRDGSDVRVIAVRMVGNQMRPIRVDGAKLSLIQATVTSSTATPDGGGAQVTSGTLDSRGTIWIDNTSTSGGGHIYAVDSLVYLSLDTLSRGLAFGQGGAVYLEDSDLGGEYSAFDDNVALDSGGAVYQVGSNPSVQLFYPRFRSNSGGDGGAYYYSRSDPSGDALVQLNAPTFEDNESSGNGGGLYLNHAAAELTHPQFLGNQSSTAGGALFASGSTSLSFAPDLTSASVAGLFCHNRGKQGGAIHLDTESPPSLSHLIFVDNQADSGGALWASMGFDIEFSHFVGNGAGSEGGAIAFYGPESETFSLTDTLVAYTSGTAIEAELTTHPPPTLTRLASWQNQRFIATGLTLDSDLIDTNPRLARYTANGNCLDDDLSHDWWSPLKDAGDPNQLDGDGTRSDIGVYGVLDPKPSVLTVDQDGDGFIAQWDCDDADPAFNPDADNPPYDGIFHNCDDRTSDYDFDKDGYPVETSGEGGPYDCRDKEPEIHPGAEEIPYDNIDQDCDGDDESDLDNDGYPGGPRGSDCEDEASDGSAYNPGAIEKPDEPDLDCDGYGDVIIQPVPRECATGPQPAVGGLILIVLAYRRRRLSTS